MVDDRVDGDGGFAGLAVADDQLALPTTNWGHCVDRLNARLQWLVHRFATHDSGCLHFDSAHDCTNDFTLAVDWHTERIDDSTKHGVANRHRQNAARGFDGLLFFDAVGITQYDDANGVFVQVEGQAHAAVFELKQFVYRAIGQATDAGDAVANFCHATNGAGLDRWRVALETFGNRRCDIRSRECEFRHDCFPFEWRLETCFDLIETGADGVVDYFVTDRGHEPTNDARVDHNFEVHGLTGNLAEGFGQACFLGVSQGHSTANFGNFHLF